jgi:hypothetical protein
MDVNGDNYEDPCGLMVDARCTAVDILLGAKEAADERLQALVMREV